MKSRRLTVIIPGYNNPEKWWRRCVDSVLANIGDMDEVICVDDGSEKRPSVLQEYAKKDSRTKVIYRERNGGLSVARNDALVNARGEYITFVDSDDEIMPGTYEKALAALGSGDADVVLFGVRSIWVNEKLFKEDIPNEMAARTLDAESVKNLYEASLLNYAWNKVYRASFLKSHKMSFDPSGMPCEDIIFVLQCIMAGAKWGAIHHIGINYYRTHASLLSRYKSSYVEGTRNASELWRHYKESIADAKVILGSVGEVSEKELMSGEWDNIWRIDSPYGLRDKWRFLASHPGIAFGANPILVFIKKLFCSGLRKYLYTASVQRWHIKRVYPTVKPYI